MATCPGKSPLWWDRALDPTGNPIRADVRAAAQEVWAKACKMADTVLGDAGEAAALMERSVAQISRYLDRIGAAVCAQNAAGLLMCGFARSLRRRATKLRRIELVGNISEFAERRPAPSCTTKEDCRMDAEKASRQLSKRGRTMLGLRSAGFEWKEIGQILNTTDTAARAEFSREVKRAGRKAREPRSKTRS